MYNEGILMLRTQERQKYLKFINITYQIKHEDTVCILSVII